AVSEPLPVWTGGQGRRVTCSIARNDGGRGAHTPRSISGPGGNRTSVGCTLAAGYQPTATPAPDRCAARYARFAAAFPEIERVDRVVRADQKRNHRSVSDYDQRSIGRCNIS